MNKPAAVKPESSYPARFTADEFVDMLECGAFAEMKIELIEGELQRVNPAMTEHSRLQGEVYFQLRNTLGGDAGRRVFVESGIVIGDRSVLGPDVIVTGSAVDERRMLRPEEVLLAVEIADETLGRDLGLKQFAYAAASLPVYWVVDAKGRAVHVMTGPSGDRYTSRQVIRFGEPLAVPGSNQSITIE